MASASTTSCPINYIKKLLFFSKIVLYCIRIALYHKHKGTMRDTFIHLFGQRLTYRDLMQLLVAFLLWNLVMIWHDRFQAYKPLIDMVVSHKWMQ